MEVVTEKVNGGVECFRERRFQRQSSPNSNARHVEPAFRARSTKPGADCQLAKARMSIGRSATIISGESSAHGRDDDAHLTRSQMLVQATAQQMKRGTVWASADLAKPLSAKTACRLIQNLIGIGSRQFNTSPQARED
jgi:hypothetical protein